MDIDINHKVGLYVADRQQYRMAYATSSSSLVYTKAEETRAKQA